MPRVKTHAETIKKARTNKVPITKTAKEVFKQEFDKDVSDIKKETGQQIVKDFSEKLPIFIEQRKKDFEEMLEVFKIENDVKIKTNSGKVADFKLSNMLSKPLIFNGFVRSKLSADDIWTYSQCYWYCVELANENFLFIPTIQQLSSLMGISKTTFIRYKDSEDENVREVIEMIYDKFVDFYTVRGLKNELNTIMAIFAMKAQYGLRDNEPTQVTFNNISATVNRNDIEELEKQYNIPSDDIIDGEI